MKNKTNNKASVVAIAAISLLCGLPSLLMILFSFGSGTASGGINTVIYIFIIMGFLSLVLSLVLWGFWYGTYSAQKINTPASPKINDEPEITDKRVRDLVDRPKVSFHFVDKDAVETYYNDLFREPVYESFSNEVAGGASKGISLTTPSGVGGRIERENSSKQVVNMRVPERTLQGKFVRYQKQTVLKGQVKLNVELVESDLSDLHKFDKLLSELMSSFDLSLDEVDAIKQRRALLKKDAVKKTLARLENIEGDVLIFGKFNISELDSDTYKFTYIHPVNDYLTETENKITIGFSLRKHDVEPSFAGMYAEDIGKSFLLKVYGNIPYPLDGNNGRWEIRIIPLAVYQ